MACRGPLGHVTMWVWHVGTLGHVTMWVWHVRTSRSCDNVGVACEDLSVM